MDADQPNRFQILSLDGGGIKGLFSAAVLAAIEDDCGKNVIDSFDLITGTSTGGIIALALGIGMRPKEIVSFYLENGKSIFNNPLGWRSIQHLFHRKYSPAPLENALRSCFGSKNLCECKKRIVIPSFNLGENDVYIFKTPHHTDLRRDYKVPIWKVALATSAAPTFFPCHESIDSTRLIDGGVWSNNPSLIGVIEAHKCLGIPLSSIAVMSIGTTLEIKSMKRTLNTGGLAQWLTSSVAVILQSQSIATNNYVTLLLGKENVLRLNPVVPDKLFKLDGFNKADDLIGKAAHFSRIYCPSVNSRFLNHSAPDYHPFYQLS